MAIDINIPSQVKTYADLASFPATGSLKTIFIAEDTNKTYRWTGTAYVEVSAAGATGITIGTTAITSGTVGRVLFEGTGNVVSESANLFFDNTNGRLGIGGTPTGATQITYDATSQNGLVLRNTATGSLFTNIDFLSTNGSASIGRFGINVSSGEFRWTCQSGGYFPTIYSNGVERLRIASTGNVLINTTTDAGFKLDVNGTARVSGLLSVNQINLGGTQIYLNQTSAPNCYLFSASTISILNGTSVRLSGGSVSVNATNNGAAADASAIFDVQSTVKGFLCPRMTTTQINAIASPAEGLQIYNTTISHMCFYQAGSWVKINHSPM